MHKPMPRVAGKPGTYEHEPVRYSLCTCGTATTQQLRNNYITINVTYQLHGQVNPWWTLGDPGSTQGWLRVDHQGQPRLTQGRGMVEHPREMVSWGHECTNACRITLYVMPWAMRHVMGMKQIPNQLYLMVVFGFSRSCLLQVPQSQNTNKKSRLR